MRIALYSVITNNCFDRSVCRVDIYPSPYEQLADYIKKYPQNEWVIVTTPAHLFLVDQGEERRIYKERGIQFHLLPESSKVEDYLETICHYQPDLAIAMSFPGIPVDSNMIMDAVISEQLRRKGIRTFAHSCRVSEIFSDKWHSHNELKAFGFPVARAVHYPQIIFYLEKNKELFSVNTYKEKAYHEMAQLTYPVVIKGAFSSAAIGVQIAENFDEARHILDVHEGSLDLIIEEKIEGEPFGAEIHGYPGHYVVSPPFKLSTQDNGISSATDNVKGGPFLHKGDEISKLEEMLIRLAETMQLTGNAQVDLFFTKEGWKILEINPRISGMTVLIGAAEGHSILECLLDPLIDPEAYVRTIQRSTAISLRVPIQNEALCRKLIQEEHVVNLWQNDNVMLQNCQVTLGGYGTIRELNEGLRLLQQKYPLVFTDELLHFVELFWERN